MSEPIPAKGVTGMLLMTTDGKFFFRKVNGPEDFVDYRIDHTDMYITITEDNACLYHPPGMDPYIDETPESLGLTNE